MTTSNQEEVAAEDYHNTSKNSNQASPRKLHRISLISVSTVDGTKGGEQVRNSVMFDLLYVHHAHPLASQVFHYYRICFNLPPHMKFFLWINRSTQLQMVECIIDNKNCIF